MANQAVVAAAVAATNGPKSLQSLIQESARELGRALPDHLRPERLVRIALTCIRQNPVLSKCTPESFLGALFTAAQIGIEPIAGRAYLLPFNNNRLKLDGTWHSVKEAQFVMGYKGLAELFYRHEKAVQLDWGVVHAGDEFDYSYGTSAFLKHKPAMKGRGEPIAYYVMATLKSGGKPFMVMSSEECMAHGRDHSKTYDQKTGQFNDKSPWATDPESMSKKTVLIQLAKLLPLSVELQRAIQADETSRDYRKGIDNALDLPDTAVWDTTAEPQATTPAMGPPPAIAKITQAQVLEFSTKSGGKTEDEIEAYLKAKIGSSQISDIPADFYKEALAWAETKTK